MSYSPTGIAVAQLLLMSMLSSLSSIRSWWRLHQRLAMPSKLVSATSWFPTSLPAALEFVPFVIVTLGGLSEDTISTIRAIGRAVGQRSGTSDLSHTSKHLFRRVAIALWRDNASLWLHWHSSLPTYLDGLM